MCATRTSPHALIVGGTRGSGRAVVRRFAAMGTRVSVFGRGAPPETDRGPKDVAYWAVDLRLQAARKDAIDQVLAKSGALTNLVLMQRFRGEGDAWADEIEVSLTATKEMIEAVADRFDGSPANAIVLVASAAGRYVAAEQPVGYHVAKAGLLHMARYYAVALGHRGIRVNCVSPASVLKDESRDFYEKNPALMAFYREIIPIGRIPTSEDIANVVAFLCSPEAGAITGQDIVADGGLSLRAHEALARSVSPFSDLTFVRPAKD